MQTAAAAGAPGGACKRRPGARQCIQTVSPRRSPQLTRHQMADGAAVLLGLGAAMNFVTVIRILGSGVSLGDMFSIAHGRRPIFALTFWHRALVALAVVAIMLFGTAKTGCRRLRCTATSSP